MAAPLNPAELLPLLDALAPAEWRSGEELAAQAGITRAALAKRMEKLRDWGLDIEARSGLGYRLERPLERLDAAQLDAALGPQIRVQVLAQTDSTNRLLLESDADLDPQVCFAEYQTAGRGRRGRAWRSPFGANIYASLAWSFPAWPPQLTTLPLAVGVACAETLRACGLAEAGVKWPNDLYVDGVKLGGILIEHRGQAGDACRVVVGVGLNVAMSDRQAEGIDQAWTSLDAALARRGQPPSSRRALAARLGRQLVDALRSFEQQGFAPFAARWNALDLTRNQPVQVRGARDFQGHARGIDADGALLVETGAGLVRLHSGDVSLRLADGAPRP